MNFRYQYHYITGLLKRYGFRGLVRKTMERAQSPMLKYTQRWQEFQPTEEQLLRQSGTQFAFEPLISIVVPAYETPEIFLRQLIEAVRKQTYGNWELCLADGSKSEQVHTIVLEYKEEKRIRYQKLSRNGGISENTNQGFEMACGEYIALMDHDDLITPNALFEMVKTLNEEYTQEQRTYAMLYSDEDKITGEEQVHSRPHFKPDYNPEFIRRNNYFCHFLIFSKELLKEVKGLRSAYDGAQDYDFVLRCILAKAVVKHVPKILYHWRIHEGSTAGNSQNKTYAFDAGCRAIEYYLQKIEEPAKAELTTNLGVYKITYALKGTYFITVVAEEKVIEQLKQKKQTGHHSEIAGDDFELEIDYTSDPGRVNLKGDRHYVMLFKEGTRPVGEVLVPLLRVCAHRKVGAAAPRLLTKTKYVKSCGVVYGADGTLADLCEGIPAEYKGYFLHGVIPKNVSILRMDAVLMKWECYEQLSQEVRKEINIWKDAQCCFQIRKKGYQLVIDPEVSVIVDGEWLRRNKNSYLAQNKADREWMKQDAKWDAAYNPNLDSRQGHTYEMRQRAGKAQVRTGR